MPAAGGRFESALPDNLDRAGREIYRNMRRSGGSAREWLTLTWPAARSGPAWVAIWTQCSQIDSFVASTKQYTPVGTDPEDYRDMVMDQDDAFESLMRSVAANLHYRKTGDSESADRMRGLVAPGDEIAPSWLLDSSTEYSRHIHRQKAYLNAQHHTSSSPKKPGVPPKAPKGPKGPKPKGPKGKAKKGDGKGTKKSDEDE